MSKRRRVNEGMMNAWRVQSYKGFIKEELAKNPGKYASCSTADEVTALLSRDLGGRICDTRSDRSAFGEALEDLEYFEPTLFDPTVIAASSSMVTESIANLGKPEGETSVFYGEEAIDMLLQDEKDTTFYYIPLSEPRPAVAIKSERRTRVSSWQFEDDEIELEVGIPRGPAICMTAIPASQLKIVCHDFEGYYTIYKGDKPLCYLRASMNNRDFRPVSWDYGKDYEEPTYVDEWNDYLGYEDEETPVNESIANLAKRNPEREQEAFYGEEALDLLLQDRDRVTYYYYSPERNPNENRWRNRRETELRKVAYRGTPSLQIGIPEKYAMFMEEIPVSDLKVICHSYEDYYTVCDGEKPVANLVISSCDVVRPWKLEGDFPRRRDDYDDFYYEDEETPVNESIANLGKREHETSEFYGQDAADLLLQDQDWISCIFVPEDEDPAESYSNEETEIRRWNVGAKPAIAVGVIDGPAMYMKNVPLDSLKVVYHDFDGYYSIYNDETFVANVIIYGKAPYNPMKWDGETPESDDYGYNF